MKIEHKVVNEEKGVIQITTTDERWYEIDGKYYPSSSWISSFYPKGTAFYKWLASKGWDEAEEQKAQAGTRGSKIHSAIEEFVDGKEIKHDSKVLNPSTGELEELSAQEYQSVVDFAKWWKTLDKPQLLVSEQTIFNEEVGYAGTVDLVIKVGEEIWMIDVKTGLNIFPNYLIQLSSYFHSTFIRDDLKHIKADRMFILQVGYTRNKKDQFKLTEVEDKFDLFLSAKSIWEFEVANKDPKQIDLPLSIKI